MLASSRIDFTENKLYSLSDGTKSLLKTLINLFILNFLFFLLNQLPAIWFIFSIIRQFNFNSVEIL